MDLFVGTGSTPYKENKTSWLLNCFLDPSMDRIRNYIIFKIIRSYWYLQFKSEQIPSSSFLFKNYYYTSLLLLGLLVPHSISELLICVFYSTLQMFQKYNMHWRHYQPQISQANFILNLTEPYHSNMIKYKDREKLWKTTRQKRQYTSKEDL